MYVYHAHVLYTNTFQSFSVKLKKHDYIRTYVCTYFIHTHILTYFLLLLAAFSFSFWISILIATCEVCSWLTLTNGNTYILIIYICAGILFIHTYIDYHHHIRSAKFSSRGKIWWIQQIECHNFTQPNSVKPDLPDSVIE